MENFVYPKGAIQSVEEFKSFIGGELYVVYGLGHCSFITKISDIKNIVKNNIGIQFDCVKYDDLSDHLYLGDFNIGKHHNDHFIFTNEEDAKIYLAYAKEHSDEATQNMFEDYEDDYPDYD